MSDVIVQIRLWVGLDTLVEPLYNGHHWDQKTLSFITRCPLLSCTHNSLHTEALAVGYFENLRIVSKNLPTPTCRPAPSQERNEGAG